MGSRVQVVTRLVRVSESEALFYRSMLHFMKQEMAAGAFLALIARGRLSERSWPSLEHGERSVYSFFRACRVDEDFLALISGRAWH
jgi:hypothetical protein